MFFDRFEELCKAKGVKPTNACVEAGLSRGLASKWKSEGTKIPSVEALQKLSVYFGISMEKILDEEKNIGVDPSTLTEQKETPTTFAGDRDEVTKEIFDEINSMSQEEKQTFLDFVRMFKARKDR